MIQHPMLAPISTSVSHRADCGPQPLSSFPQGRMYMVLTGQFPLACTTSTPASDRLAGLWHWPYGGAQLHLSPNNAIPLSLQLILSSWRACISRLSLKLPILTNVPLTPVTEDLPLYSHTPWDILLTMADVGYFWRGLIPNSYQYGCLWCPS